MPDSWWAARLEKQLSQGDILKEILLGTSPAVPVYLERSSRSGKRAWEERLSFEADNDGLGYFLARGRLLPCIVLSHDCTIANDGARARILVAPMFPWSYLNSQDPKYRDAVLRQEQRSFLPLTNVPLLNGDYYADLRAICYVDRRTVEAATRVASMSTEGLERLQHQLADFFIRLDVPNEHLALSRKSEG